MAALQQVGEPEVAVPVLGQPDEPMGAARFREPGVQAGLDIHLVVSRPRSGRDRQGRRIPSEVLGKQPADRLFLGPGHSHRPRHEPPGEPADIGQFGTVILARYVPRIHTRQHRRPAGPRDIERSARFAQQWQRGPLLREERL